MALRLFVSNVRVLTGWPRVIAVCRTTQLNGVTSGAAEWASGRPERFFSTNENSCAVIRPRCGVLSATVAMFRITDIAFVSNKRLYLKNANQLTLSIGGSSRMAPTVFEENVAPVPTAQQARGLADWLRTCVGLVMPTGAAESSGNTSRQHIRDEPRPPPVWREAQCPEDEVRRHFRHEIKQIMRQGPLGTDFVLCAVGRMAEDILRIEDSAVHEFQLADQWIEYARRILPGFSDTIAS
jgi:hypothetical protein